MKNRFVVGAIAALSLAGMASARPDIAIWTFETSVPTTAGPHAAEVGTGSAFANTGGVISNPVGNGSVESMSSTAWDLGDNYEFRTSSTGYQNISITWDQTSSNTGPRDFNLQISTNGGGSYSTIMGYMVLANAAPNTVWSSGGGRLPEYTFTASLGIAAANLADLRIRFTQSSTVSANGGTVAGTGTDRVDNVQISGDLIPTPGALALAGVAGLVGFRRRRS
ncbi:MAG: hypothetical protein JNK58_04165 [Phycisphaerae bacterium]|nr:hypothetical protein [Phycisphaerae bacterium]